MGKRVVFGCLWVFLAAFVPTRTVLAVTTVTSLTTSWASISAGQGVSFCAVVSGNSPTGTIQFKDGTTNLGAAIGLTSLGMASISTSALTVGNHVITGVYSGDSTNTGSTSQPLSETVVNPFNAAGSMATPRNFHTATLLPNGRVLIVGGQTITDTLASVEIYDPAANTWTSAMPLGTKRSLHTATLLPNGKVLVVGGAKNSNNTGELASVELYDPAANTWTLMTPLATAREGHTATLLPNGKVLVVGGANGTSELASVELYDPAGNTWTPMAPLSTGRSHHTATLLATGKVLVAAGTAGGVLNAELYDSASNTWSAAGVLSALRLWATATLLTSGEVLVAGGFEGFFGHSAGFLNSAELYNPATNTWSAAATLTIARSFHTAALLPTGKVLVVGGNGNNTAELYDRTTNTWSAAGTLTVARGSATATLLPTGKVVVAGGRDNNALPPNAELYDAAASQSLPPDPSTVAPPVAIGVATTVGASTQFLYSSSNPIQVGVVPGTIVLQHASVIRGKVRDNSNPGAPLPGVTITILNHPEFGQTLSRVDGMFDIAVNGGAPLNVKYDKVGLLSAQRQVQVSWGDYAIAPDVVLIPEDTNVTTLDLTSNLPMQSARGSLVHDNDGTRQPTLLFPLGTQATMLLPNGTTQPLTTLSLRATEFTQGPNGPQAMPSDLPPTSGYTYATDFSVDEAITAGASRVTLSKPIIEYVDNFMNYQVGADVPIASYDHAGGVSVEVGT